MSSLATPPIDTLPVASDATVRTVRRRLAGAIPAADLAARAPEAAATSKTATHASEGRAPLPPYSNRGQPTRTRASAGKGDTPDNVNGLCPHGTRRPRRSAKFGHSAACLEAIGSSTAGHGAMPAVERPPRFSRTSALLQAYNRGRCTTTLPGTSARGHSALLHCWFHRCTGASPVRRHHRRVSPFAAVAGRSTRVQVPPVGLQGALRP